MQVRIKGYTFQLSEPFEAGGVLTKGEAQALNSLKAENVSNNLRKLVSDAVAGLPEGELLAEDTIAGIQATITNYDLAYQFPEKHQPRLRVGDIEAEARAIAEARVDSKVRNTGAELSPETRELLVAEMSELPAVVEEARLVVTARRRAISGGLDSL